MSFNTVKSKDGTSIAFEALGKGKPLVLIGGAFCDRSTPTSGMPLASLLAHRFTVFSYDRRGRGDSGNASPFAIEREVEDLAALISEAGDAATVFGNSSGGLLAIEAAIQGLSIPKLVLYEPPVILDPVRAKSLEDLAKQLDAAVTGNRRAEAVELFFTRVMQIPVQTVAQMRKAPMWPGLEELAHTLSYDLLFTARGPARLKQLSDVRAATLVLSGGESPSLMRESIETLAGAIPNARHQTLKGQTHSVDPKVLAKSIEEFLVP
jgi:pimeloyl-ACP methyl ester carboxylesterase